MLRLQIRWSEFNHLDRPSSRGARTICVHIDSEHVGLMSLQIIVIVTLINSHYNSTHTSLFYSLFIGTVPCVMFYPVFTMK